MIRSACYVACDVCTGDPAEVATNGAKEARLYALQAGFIRVKVDGRFLDICPNCQDHMEAK